MTSGAKKRLYYAQHAWIVPALGLLAFALSGMSCRARIDSSPPEAQACQQEAEFSGQFILRGQRQGPQDSRPMLEGQVYYNGKALPGVSVVVDRMEIRLEPLDFTAYSDKDGVFRISVDSPGDYRVAAFHEGFHVVGYTRLRLESEKVTTAMFCMKKETSTQELLLSRSFKAR